MLNLTQIITTGGTKFNGEQFTDANDALATYNMKDVGADLFLELDREISSKRNLR